MSEYLFSLFTPEEWFYLVVFSGWFGIMAIFTGVYEWIIEARD